MRGSISVTIKGQSVGLRFGVPSVQAFAEAVTADKKGVYFAGENLSDYGWAKMLQCAYDNQCLLDEVEPKLKLGSFVDFIEESIETEEGKELLAKVMLEYAESSVGKKITEEAQKKRLAEETSLSTSTPSNPSASESLAGDPETTTGQPSEKLSLQSQD